MSDPSTYRNDRRGPSLVGVLLVHMLPGVAAAAVMVLVLISTAAQSASGHTETRLTIHR